MTELAVTFAPASIKSVGRPVAVGIGAAIAGRATPSIRPMYWIAATRQAPVLPAETVADALPSATSFAATTRDAFGFDRTDCMG